MDERLLETGDTRLLETGDLRLLEELPVFPVAQFSGTPVRGIFPLTVTFTDQSTDATSWAWDFGDGGSSVLQNPTHEYAAVGQYTVTLTATNSAGSDPEVKVNYVTVTAPSVFFM